MNDDRIYETTGQFLRGCRIRKGLQQKDIAELTNMSKHTISKIESDDKDRMIRKKSNLLKVAKAYGFEIEEYKKVAQKQMENHYKKKDNII